jgi:hypothetical protein
MFSWIKSFISKPSPDTDKKKKSPDTDKESKKIPIKLQTKKTTNLTKKTTKMTKTTKIKTKKQNKTKKITNRDINLKRETRITKNQIKKKNAREDRLKRARETHIPGSVVDFLENPLPEDEIRVFSKLNTESHLVLAISGHGEYKEILDKPEENVLMFSMAPDNIGCYTSENDVIEVMNETQRLLHENYPTLNVLNAVRQFYTNPHMIDPKLQLSIKDPKQRYVDLLKIEGNTKGIQLVEKNKHTDIHLMNKNMHYESDVYTDPNFRFDLHIRVLDIRNMKNVHQQFLYWGSTGHIQYLMHELLNDKIVDDKTEGRRSVYLKTLVDYIRKKYKFDYITIMETTCRLGDLSQDLSTEIELTKKSKNQTRKYLKSKGKLYYNKLGGIRNLRGNMQTPLP